MGQSNFFQNFQSKAIEFNQLQPGKDIKVRINRFVFTDSRHEFDGTRKSELPDYADATPQVAVVFVSTEGKGVITNRYNGCGYVRYAELTADQIKSSKYIDVDGYACIKNKQDELVRIEDPERTRSCENILSQLFAGAGLEEGSTMDDLQNAVEENRELLIDVKAEEYEGKTQYRVARTKKVSAESMAESSLDSF